MRDWTSPSLEGQLGSLPHKLILGSMCLLAVSQKVSWNLWNLPIAIYLLLSLLLFYFFFFFFLPLLHSLLPLQGQARGPPGAIMKRVDGSRPGPQPSVLDHGSGAQQSKLFQVACCVATANCGIASLWPQGVGSRWFCLGTTHTHPFFPSIWEKGFVLFFLD